MGSFPYKGKVWDCALRDGVRPEIHASSPPAPSAANIVELCSKMGAFVANSKVFVCQSRGKQN